MPIYYTLEIHYPEFEKPSRMAYAENVVPLIPRKGERIFAGGFFYTVESILHTFGIEAQTSGMIDVVTIIVTLDSEQS